MSNRIADLCEQLRREAEADPALARLMPGLTELATLVNAQREANPCAEMLRSFIQGQQDERRRLASRLHDGLCQYLTALLLGAQVAQTAKSRRDSQEAMEAVRRNCSLALADTRRLIEELRPSLLDDFGLKLALERLAGPERFAPLTVTVDVAGLPVQRLAGEIESGLYAIAFQYLRRAALHSNGGEVQLTALVEAGHAELHLFASSIASPEEMLGREESDLRTHAAILGGALRMVTCPPAGSELIVHVPLERAARVHDSSADR